MTEEKIGIYHKICWEDIKPPEKVRCMNCGKMIGLETNELGFDVTLWIYACYDCRHWTEWEHAPDEDDDNISSIWLVDMDDKNQESIWTRDFPAEYFWEPNEDGYTAPEFEKVK